MSKNLGGSKILASLTKGASMTWTTSKPKNGGNPQWHCIAGGYFYRVKRITNGFRWEVTDKSGRTVNKGSKPTLSQAKAACKSPTKK